MARSIYAPHPRPRPAARPNRSFHLELLEPRLLLNGDLATIAAPTATIDDQSNIFETGGCEPRHDAPSPTDPNSPGTDRGSFGECPGDPDPNPKPNPNPNPVPAPVNIWSQIFDLPYEVIHAHLLPTGKVLFWAHYGITFTWDPLTKQFGTPAQPDYDTYCTGHSFLEDGTLLVAGGHVHGAESLSHASTYDPFADSWTRVAPMNDGRCYASNTTLGTGDVLTISGEASDGSRNLIPQVWMNDEQTWRDLGQAARELPNYPYTYLGPDGRVFEAGPNSDTSYLNIDASGSWSAVDDTQTELMREYGSSTLVAPGKVMIVGGGETPTSAAETIDLGSSAPTWQLIAPMHFPRRHLYATLLPDETVLVTGGTAGTGFNDPTGAVLTPELWDPRTGLWAILPNLQYPRLYHSIALLLPDGRILLAGGDLNDGAGSQWKAEIYSPPYLFKGPQPRLTYAPSQVDYGQSFFIETPDAATVSKVSVVRLGSVTHGFNQSQAFSGIAFTRQPGRLQLAGLNDPNITPPGYYMVFLVSADGVPSQAQIVQLRDEAGPTVISAQLIRSRKKKLPSQINVTFNEPVQPDRANDSANFDARLPGRDKQFNTSDDIVLVIQNMRYNRSARAMTLTLAGRIPKQLPLQFTIVGRPTGGITDLFGHYLDGNADGVAGDDFVTIFGTPKKRR